jgi:hypothetical protein
MKKLILLGSITFLSCNGGLSPAPPAKPGISGTIYFAHGTWPGTPSSPDSLANLWLFAALDYPLDSSLVFNGLFSSPPRVVIYPSFVQNIDFYVDTLVYYFDLSPGIYKYVGVIQHITPDYNTIRSLRVVGFARAAGDSTKPLSVEIPEGLIVTGINIKVDFHNPPPQPF